MESTTAHMPEATTRDRYGDRADLQMTAPELRRLQRDLLRAVTTATDTAALLSSLGSMISESINIVGFSHFRRDEDGQLMLNWRLIPGGSNPRAEAIQQQALRVSTVACEKGRCQLDTLDDGEEHVIISVPVFHRQRAPEALAVVLPVTTRSLDRTIVTLELVATHLTLWQVLQDSSGIEIEAQSSAALLDLVSKLATSDDLQRASYTLVCELQEYFGCELVAVGMRHWRKGECRLQAISGTARFDRNSAITRCFEAAFDEAILRGTLAVWPPPTGSPRHATLAQQRLIPQTGAQTVIGAPLYDSRGEAVGAWVLLGDEKFGQRQDVMSLIRVAQNTVGCCLQGVKQSERGPVTRCVRLAVENRRTWQTKTLVLAACVLLGIMAMPIQYQVRCDCEIEPVIRRFVAAPFDGELEQAMVELGDVVSQGDLLARMDGRQIRLELAELTAERGRVAKERDVGMASHDISAAQFAQLNMQQLDLKIEMLRRRASHLDIASPIDGVVIHGDHEKDEGAPLTTGQTLFEIAPLDTMTAEIAVPEEDITHVRSGLKVTIQLDAFPQETWTGTIARVQPRSEDKDHQNVFVAEVVLDNPDALLRPGNKGRAKILAGRHPWGWNLFHKSWDYLLHTLRW